MCAHPMEIGNELGKILCLLTTDFRANDEPVKTTEGHKCELPEIGEEAIITFDYGDRSVFNLREIFSARQSL